MTGGDPCRHTVEVSERWTEPPKVHEYVTRVGSLAPRRAGEAELLEALPGTVDSLLDLGCGDARLARLVAKAHPELTRATVTDSSEPMLELARCTVGSDPRFSVHEHDLHHPLQPLGMFDAVITGFAVHHVSDERKRSLFEEVLEVLEPGGVFANLEVVRCATPSLHAEFYRRIGRTDDDPEDVLAPVEPQLDWMRQAGLIEVDCQWRWRGFALLVGQRP